MSKSEGSVYCWSSKKKKKNPHSKFFGKQDRYRKHTHTGPALKLNSSFPDSLRKHSSEEMLVRWQKHAHQLANWLDTYALPIL